MLLLPQLSIALTERLPEVAFERKLIVITVSDPVMEAPVPS